MVSHSSYMHDRPTTEDTLGRSYFAKALSHSLILPNSSPGLVVGIEGNWGSGKSTLIGFIKKNLGEITGDIVPIVVDFNPWMLSNTGALVEALIGQIATSIGKDSSLGEKRIKAGQKLIGYIRFLKYLKYLRYAPTLEWMGNVAEDISGSIQEAAITVEKSTDTAKKALDDAKKLLPSLDLSQKKNEVVAALAELDHPIVVVIDDLDRLPAEEIRAMVQAIKAVADFPRITYLLAYDRNIIARALADNKESGFSYLEKIVQVAYPIPPLSQRQLKKFADDKVQALLHELNITLCSYEVDRYDEAIVLLAKLARHPRDIVRIISRLILSLPMTHGEVNGVDVIVFEALSQRFPALRESMHSHSADFTGQPSRGDLVDENSGFDWEKYAGIVDKNGTKQPWLKYLPEEDHDQRISEKACLFLFPTQEKDGVRVIYEDCLRIADPDRLARLFRMTAIEEVPEAKEIHELLIEPEKLKGALSTEVDAELSSLLDWVIRYIPSCPNPSVKGCIGKLTEISNELTSQYRLADEIANKFADVMKKLLRLKTPKCNGCFLSIIQNAPLSISERIVFFAAKDQGKWKIRPEDRVSEDHQLISDSGLVDEAIRTWTKRVRECDVQGNLYKEANLHSILYRYAQFSDNYDCTYLAISKICETDEGLAAFLRSFKEKVIHFEGWLMLVEDAEKLAQRIAESTLKHEYLWLSKLLGEEGNIQLVREQAAKLQINRVRLD